MKYLLTILILSLSINANAVEDDKRKHFWASGAISSGIYLLMRSGGYKRIESYATAVVFSLAVGTVKELTDDKFDVKDMQYNAMGALSVPVIVIGF